MNGPGLMLGWGVHLRGSMNLEFDPVRWRRSSRCAGESACVEIAPLTDGTIGIRDAKLPAGSPFIAVEREAYRAFLSAVKAGEFSTNG